MRMLVTWRNEMACNFDARVASLDGPLKVRQISTNENVDIGCVKFLRSYLRETGVHFFPFANKRFKHHPHDCRRQGRCQIGRVSD